MIPTRKVIHEGGGRPSSETNGLLRVEFREARKEGRKKEGSEGGKKKGGKMKESSGLGA